MPWGWHYLRMTTWKTQAELSTVHTKGNVTLVTLWQSNYTESSRVFISTLLSSFLEKNEMSGAAASAGASKFQAFMNHPAGRPLILLNVSFSLHTLPQGPRLYSFGLHWWSGAWWEPAWRIWPVLLISSVFHKTSVRMVMYWRLTVIQVSIKRSLGRYRVYLGSVFPCDYTSQLQSGCCAQHLFSSGVPCWQFPSR